MDNLEETEKFLEKCGLLRLNQEEVENINRPATSTEIETVTQNLLKNKSLGTNDFPGEFYQTFREDLILNLLKLFQKISDEGILPNLFYKTTITLIPNPDKDVTENKITGQ